MKPRVEPDYGTAKPSGGRLSRHGLFPIHRLWIVLFFLTLLCPALVPQTAEAGPADAVPSGEVTLCEYSPGNTSPIVEVHAANLFADYERWGFFRIGALPIMVADHVQVEIRSARYLGNALADLKRWDPTAAVSGHFELRNLEITLRGEKEPRLRARLGRPGSDGTLKLTNVTFREDSGKQIPISKATLQIAGPSAGHLCWSSAGHQEERFILKTLNNKRP